MQAFFTLVRRELGAHFVSWTGYVIIGVVTFILGLSFVGILQAVNTVPMTGSFTEMFYDSYTFWLILLITTPIITMRTFAQERYSGTFETLMTAPVSDRQVVLAKFTGAVVFYCLMWVPLAGQIFLLQHYTQQAGAVDPGALVSTFAGILLLGMLYVSLGCLASSLTESQMVSAMVAFVAGITLFLLSFLAYALPPQLGWTSAVFGYINMFEHMRDFSRGVLDTREPVYYLTMTFLCLYLTLKVVESRRWK